MTRYVCGFMIDNFQESSAVLLILKQRPEWQKGRLNGIGGKVEPGESTSAAMVREFREETGISTLEDEWYHFLTLNGAEVYDSARPGNFEVYFFVTRSIIPARLNSPTDEKLVEVNARDLWSQPVLPNLLWLVPMALSRITRGAQDRAPGFYVTEWSNDA